MELGPGTGVFCAAGQGAGSRDSYWASVVLSLSLSFFLLTWREFFIAFRKGNGRGEERETHTSTSISIGYPLICTPIGDQTCSLFAYGMVLQQSHASQGRLCLFNGLTDSCRHLTEYLSSL